MRSRGHRAGKLHDFNRLGAPRVTSQNLVVPSQNPIRVASMADGGGVGQAPIALNCLLCLLGRSRNRGPLGVFGAVVSL
jgi:hypothetical protein